MPNFSDTISPLPVIPILSEPLWAISVHERFQIHSVTKEVTFSTSRFTKGSFEAPPGVKELSREAKRGIMRCSLTWSGKVESFEFASIV